jgi:hypothetical protein
MTAVPTALSCRAHRTWAHRTRPRGQRLTGRPPIPRPRGRPALADESGRASVADATCRAPAGWPRPARRCRQPGRRRTPFAAGPDAGRLDTAAGSPDTSGPGDRDPEQATSRRCSSSAREARPAAMHRAELAAAGGPGSPAGAAKAAARGRALPAGRPPAHRCHQSDHWPPSGWARLREACAAWAAMRWTGSARLCRSRRPQ